MLNSYPIEKELRYVLFELTCAWGMYPLQPLGILGLSLLIFSFPYMTAIRMDGRTGIWRIWPPERIHKDEGQNVPERLNAKGLKAWLIGFYFSILSAFRIGWRDINVGNWIARIQPREYGWRATGWVRTVSGIQSLFSAYLLVIWVLTYWSRPFG